MIMKNFEFKSAICTSVEQSKRLLELGLKKETADCMYSVMTKSYNGRYILEEDKQYNLILFHQEEVQSVGFSHYELIPAWSLHRLMEIMPKNIGCYEQFVSCYKNDVMYINEDGYSFFNRTKNDNLYDGIIDCIKWAIVNRYINPQFLEGKQ